MAEARGMDGSGFTIGQVATKSGLSQRALRFYEKRGLLGPVTRDLGGRRRYSQNDVDRADHIVAVRQLGVPLDRVSEVIDDSQKLDQFLDAQLRRTDEHIGQLQTFRADLARVRAARAAGHHELRGFVSVAAIACRVRELAGRLEIDGFPAELGDAVEVEFPRLYAEADRLMRSGAAVDSAPVQEVAARMEELGASITRDRAAGDAVRSVWREHSAELTGRDYSDLADFVDAARALAAGRRS
jgi:DNA-binding transcriptional MerR regulator